jgi:hypothetical protein
MSKTYYFFGSKSSESHHTNGATLRMQTIRNVLNELGFTDSSKLQLGREIGVELIVIGSIGSISRILFKRIEMKIIWLDVCDTWMGSRFGSAMGLSARLKGIAEIFLILYMHIRFRHRFFVTYISNEDRRIDRFLFRRQEKFVLPNDIEQVKVGKSNDVGFVFSGDASFYPNRLAIKNLTNALKKANWVNPKIAIYGRGWEEIADPNYFKISLFVPTHQLYRQSQIYLVPTRSGFGIKNKLVIPMSLGLRVICLKGNTVGLHSHPHVTILEKIEDFPESMKSHLGQRFKFREEHFPVYLLSEREGLKGFLVNSKVQL